ncbi:MAG: carboxypeptidase regulatory-like domain-containing protein [Acidobacteria bacterium]|nr:carboxypeptidase regulatory-like domain-containing protein [Acidobacteriota bacterium]
MTAIIAVLVLLAGVPMWAQDARGTISGRVTDPSGAILAGAQVVVTNIAMGTKTSLATNNEGRYLAPVLPPGMYQVEVTATGFKKAVRSDVELRIGDRLDVSMTMEIGAQEQSVTVTGELPLLNSETASIGTVVDSQRVANLPLSYGNPFLLIGLTAGVTFNGSVRLDRPFEPTHIVNYSMGGTRGNLNDITIDGAPTTATANANEVTASYVPPTDIVQEFKVQTATFDAQFGQTQGGVTSISIKSGTNQFHGSAGYSFTRQSMWANDFFNNKKGLAVPNFSFDRWGGSISGPVTIPKVYDGKNKTFFLWGYEGIKDSRPRHDDTTNTVPTPAMMNGDFSALTAAGGSAYTIYDPATRIQLANGRFQQTAFPGNKIPTARFDKVGTSILKYYPATPKSTGDAFGIGNYTDASLAEKADYYNNTVRVDQNIGDRQRLFVRYSQYRRDSLYNDYFGNAMTGIQFLFDSKTGMIDHVITLSPTMVLNSRYSYNRFIRGSDGSPAGMGFDITQLGFSQQYASQVPPDIARFPRINLTGYISNGFTGELRPVNNHTASTTLTKALGKHSIKAGMEFRIYQEADKFFSNAQTGQYTFDATWTRGPLDNSATAPGSIGQSVASLLLGLPGSGSIARSADYIEQSNSWGFFIQDDFKITNRLTLNLGIRYELETPLHERYNKSTLSFDPAYKQDISDTALVNYAKIYPNISGGFPELPVSAFSSNGGMTFAGVNGNPTGLYNTPKNVFLPRIGLAYQVGQHTVLRSGFGMFAGFLGERRGDVQQNGWNQNTTMVLTRDNGLNWLTTLANPYPSGVTEPKGNSDGYKTFLGQGFTFFNQNPNIPMTMRWEFGLQQEFKGYALDVNYIGSKTSHTEVTRNINALPRQYWSTKTLRDDANNNYLSAAISNPYYQLVPGNTQGTYTSATTTRQALLAPYRVFGSNAINSTENSGFSWYHGLQMSVNKRFAKGFTVMGSYTFSKWMQAVNLLNAVDKAPIHEISDADAPHRINFSSIYELPFGDGKKFLADQNRFVKSLVGGWQVSGIWTLQSGFPLAWGNAIFYGDPSSILRPLDQRTPEQWFNIAGFEQASNKQLLGNQLRWWPFRFSTLRRQRMNNVDLAVIKNTRITEGTRVEFRAEALNAMNHPYFPSPNMTVTTAQSAADTGFGQINASTMDNYARRIQLSLRFLF